MFSHRNSWTFFTPTNPTLYQERVQIRATVSGFSLILAIPNMSFPTLNPFRWLHLSLGCLKPLDPYKPSKATGENGCSDLFTLK